jgi:3,4-dihydroxy-2-butanone 4-phosphate synthase
MVLMELPFYKILRSFYKKKYEKTLECQIYPGMFFSVFAGNTAIFKRKGHTEIRYTL